MSLLELSLSCCGGGLLVALPVGGLPAADCFAELFCLLWLLTVPRKPELGSMHDSGLAGPCRSLVSSSSLCVVSMSIFSATFLAYTLTRSLVEVVPAAAGGL